MYNIGKGKFMGVQSANEQPIPFAETPQSLKTTFKNISGGVEYPIMLSPDNVGAVSQNGNAGLFYWNGGWNRTDDAGSNHKVTVVGAITESTLTTIAEAVELYEEICELGDALADADNRLDAALGYYSCTAETQTELDAIEEFMATATDVAEVNAKTARVNELIATFTLNVPQAGKFYRLKGISGNYIDATSIYNNANATSGQMSMKAEANANLAGTIFYLDEGNYFLNYATGTYVRQTSEIGAVGATKGEWSFAASTRTLGKLELSCTTISNAGKNLHDNGGTRADRCSSVCGERHDWTVEEVTSLPVTVSSVGYATLYAPVALEIPTDVIAYVGVQVDNYLDLTDIKEVTGGVIPANTGVILEAKQGTYNFAIVDDVAALDKSKNLLTGKYPKSEKNASAKVYTLQNGSNGVGLYLFKGQNAQGAKTYINGFRAWVELDVASQTNALRIRKAGEATDIENSELRIQNSDVIYDLAGRRIEKIVEKGIYIVNGKKVVIR